MIGTIYFTADGNFSFPAISGGGVLPVPQLDIFDLMSGQVTGSTAQLFGTRFHRACTVGYNFTFNDDATITVTRLGQSNTAAADLAGISCNSIVGMEAVTTIVPKIRFAPNIAPTSVTVTCPNGASKIAATLSEANALCAAPLLLTISPANGAIAVSVDTASIEVTTDSTLDLSSLTATNITLKAGTIDVVGTVSAIGTKAFKFSVADKLNYAQPYTFTATVKDKLGKPLAVNGIFTTASVSCVSPQVPNSTGNACAVSQELACSISKHQYGDIAYPTEYNGAFQIPLAKQKLITTTLRGIAIKDDYPYRDGLLTPPKDSACIDKILYMHNIFKETLDRIKSDGADQVYFYNFATWNIFQNTS